MSQKTYELKVLRICRLYFIAGIFFLPVMWIINAYWFLPVISDKRQSKTMKKVDTYVKLSIIGAVLYLVCIVTWCSVFYHAKFEYPEGINVYLPIGIN
ncbi:hypothetical protein A3Q56_06508 [Intoshia linei]|uniref:Gamma-secretase subunit PEN-2 n=1 Tax=Intoshia linei TaxID=1819745 RepID=A0A177AUV9_9BILA|nr:hypothetical protein A3Q56_06508 [Intoshia linei]